MNNGIKVITKAFKIIEILNQDEQLSLKEITQRVNLPKPTVFRILNTLQSLNYVQYNPVSQSHALSHKFLILAKKYLSKNGIIHIAIPHMIHLKELFNETVNLVKLAEKEAIFLHIEESNHPFKYVDQIGDKALLHSTAAGKSILAFLPNNKLKSIIENYDYQIFTKNTISSFDLLKKNILLIRKEGFAIDDEEGHEGVMCVGAPIFNSDHSPFAALSISLPKIRANKIIIKEITQKLPKTCIQISLELGVSNIRKCFETETLS